MEKWTVADIPSQAGNLAVVTGANSGIGWQTALELARAGSEVTRVSQASSGEQEYPRCCSSVTAITHQPLAMVVATGRSPICAYVTLR